jgi:hypothetical protein
MFRRNFLSSLASFFGLGSAALASESVGRAEPAAVPAGRVESAPLSAATILPRKRFIEVRDCFSFLNFGKGHNIVSLNLDSIVTVCVGPHARSADPSAQFVFVNLGRHEFSFPVKTNEHFLEAIGRETL